MGASVFSKAERAIETYECVSLENQAAALNELRYAGYHLLKAVKTEAEKANPFVGQNDDVYCAFKHSSRAFNDVLDSTVLVSLEFIRRFLDKKYTERELQTSKHFDFPSDYLAILETRKLLEDVGMAKSIVEGSREDASLKRFRLLRLKAEKTIVELDTYRSLRAEMRDRNHALQDQRIAQTNGNRRRREEKRKKRRDWLAFVLAALSFAQAFWGCSVLHAKFISWIDSLRPAQESIDG